MLTYFLVAAFGLYFFSGISFGYIASYALLKSVAYLSPWIPIWMWIADIGLFIHSVSISASSAVGFIGAIARKLYAIKLCFYILITLLLVEIGVTVQLVTRNDSLAHALYTDLNEAMELSLKGYSRNSSDTSLWNEIQIENNCCGIDNYTDWFSTTFGSAGDVPDSCCLLVSKGCGHGIINKPHPEDIIITEGCLTTLLSTMERDYYHMGYTIWLRVMVLQLILIGVMAYVIKKLKYEPSGNVYFVSETSLQGSKYNLIKEDF